MELRDRKGQVSIEYVIILAAVIFLIVIPAAVFLSSFARDNVQGITGSEAANEVGTKLTTNAKQVYYLGLYSKKRVRVQMPAQLQDFYLLKIQQGTDMSYYVVLIDQDGNPRYYPSDIPIWSATSYPGVGPASTAYPPECSDAGTSCDSMTFTGSARLQGQKSFILETQMRDVDADPELEAVVLIRPEVS